ncbi:MAG: SLBB domain-containing protein [Planctomycetes bacterium]|nr:SLBB domain-containing protein [Planctomycetota bacterium]
MNPLEWARRRKGGDGFERPLDALRGTNVADAQARSGLSPAWQDGIRSFYDHLGDDGEAMLCTGTACAFAGPCAAVRSGSRPVACLGRCYEAPYDPAKAATRIPHRALVHTPVVLRGLLAPGDPLQEYDLPDGTTILEVVTKSGLRGRGGAAYPTGAKWRTAQQTAAPERYVVANGDEGDPGAFVDRLLLEESPHAVLAGMLACARAIGAGRGIVYVRSEYPLAVERMNGAIAQAKRAGKLDGFHVEVLRGAGSYVAGEETALLRSIEGLRAEPQPKPPYPAERGLHGLPTIVQNVETLAVVPWVVARGAHANTKAICLSGAIARPGVVEIALGTPLREVLARGGGGEPSGRRWKMALVGGPMGCVLRADEFDTPLAYDTLPGLGHGGIVLLDARVHARSLAEHLFAFAARESCGACAPCRIGTAQLPSRRTPADFERLLRTIEWGSLCGFGQGVPRPLRDLVRLFPEEMFA